jgi:hypothetical protein
VLTKELASKVAFLERNLKQKKLVTSEELSEIADRFAGRKKDDKWRHWAELHALALTRLPKASEVKEPRGMSPESLQVAVEALRETSENVSLLDGTVLTIYPASFDRIAKVEDHAWWITRLTAGRMIIIEMLEDGKKPEIVKGEVCEKCDRPLEPEGLQTLLNGIEKEISYQRSMLYAQLVAPTPAPVTEPIMWSEKITPAEDRLLLEAYHRVNFDVITRLPEAKSQDGERELPRSWAFLFAHQADREKRPAVELTRDRSLASSIAVMVMESLRDQHLRGKGKVDAEKFAEGIG